MKLTGSVWQFPSFTAVIVNINICREMKSPSCCNIIQAVKVHRCCVLYAICIPNCWTSQARAVMNNITCWIRSARPEGRRGQMVTEIVSPHLVTRLPVRSQPGICVSLYWCCPSQLSLYFSLSWVHLVSLCVSSQLQSTGHQFPAQLQPDIPSYYCEVGTLRVTGAGA